MLPTKATHHHPQWHEIHCHPRRLTDFNQSFHRNGGFNDSTLKTKTDNLAAIEIS